MKDKKRNIDEFFRKKLSGLGHDYHTGYWLRMEQMLQHPPDSLLPKSGVKIFGLSKSLFITLLTTIPAIIIVGAIVLNKQVKPDHEINKTAMEVVASDSASAPASDTFLAGSDSITDYYAGTAIHNENTFDQITLNRQKNTIKSDMKANQEVNKTITPDDVSLSLPHSKSQKPDVVVIPVKSPDVPVEVNGIKKITETTKISVVDTLKSAKKDSMTAEADTAFKTPPITANPSTEKTSPEKDKLSFNLGINVSNTLSNNSLNETKFGLAPMLGIGYYHSLDEKLRLSLSTSYFRSTGNNLERYSVRKNFFLYEEIDSIYLLTRTLDFINMNIDLQRKFSKRHYLSMGVLLSAPFLTISDFTRVRKNPFYYQSVTTPQNGYKEGIRLINFGVSVEYSCQIMKNGYAGFRFGQTLTDLIHDDLFLNNKKDYMTHFQFYIKWMLL